MAKLTLRGWLRAWLPAIFWAGVIWVLSTKYFSAENTGSALQTVLGRLFPSISADTLALLNHCIRKLAHFSEYFIFCLLIFRGFRGERKGWRWTWALAAFALAAGYSALDEIHQSFVEGRTASLFDSLLDSAGALAAMIIGWVWTHLRGSRAAAPASIETPSA